MTTSHAHAFFPLLPPYFQPKSVNPCNSTSSLNLSIKSSSNLTRPACNMRASLTGESAIVLNSCTISSPDFCLNTCLSRVELTSSPSCPDSRR
jgi:hypothetical protein